MLSIAVAATFIKLVGPGSTRPKYSRNSLLVEDALSRIVLSKNGPRAARVDLKPGVPHLPSLRRPPRLKTFATGRSQ